MLVKAALDGPFPWLKKDLLARTRAKKVGEEFSREVLPGKVLTWVMKNMV